jgi:hypothetical protein
MLHRGLFVSDAWRTTVLIIREAEPAVPRRIVQKLLADLRARRIAPFVRVQTLAVGACLWAAFARCAAQGQAGDRPNAA